MKPTDDIFDAVLYMDDPDFIEKFKAAIGAKPGEQIEIVTPQFERTDGVTPVASIDSWERLRTLSIADLKLLGCGAWDAPDERGMVLMLFPKEWYPHIPAGYSIVGISGRHEQFSPGETDNDYRYGCLAYGIEVKHETN